MSPESPESQLHCPHRERTARPGTVRGAGQGSGRYKGVTLLGSKLEHEAVIFPCSKLKLGPS